MPSPFPGMDPYLEGYLWPDVHQALAGKIRQMLTPLIRPRYTARLAVYVVEDTLPEHDIGIMYPDVEVLQSGSHRDPVASGASVVSATPAPITIPVVQPVEVRIPGVEIHDAANNRLVTCIEILSPVNKREPGLTPYLQKRRRLYQAGVHLLELDFLRRGVRPVTHARLPDVPYLILLTRAHAGAVEVWPVGLKDRLPVVPTPLRTPDPDVPLDLEEVLTAVYDEAAYDLSIDYALPPPPPEFSGEDAQWMQGLKC